jgi:hypothetical protein
MMSGFPDFIAASLPEFGKPGKPSSAQYGRRRVPSRVRIVAPPVNAQMPAQRKSETSEQQPSRSSCAVGPARASARAASALAFPSGGPAVYPHDDVTSTSFVAVKLSEFLQEAEHVVSKLDLWVRAGRHPDGGGGRRAGGR